MRVHNPPHPCEIIKEKCLAPLGLSVTNGANALGVTRQALSNSEEMLKPGCACN